MQIPRYRTRTLGVVDWKRAGSCWYRETTSYRETGNAAYKMLYTKQMYRKPPPLGLTIIF